VWLVYLLAALVILCVVEADPTLFLYLLDPELLAATAAAAAWMLRWHALWCIRWLVATAAQVIGHASETYWLTRLSYRFLVQHPRDVLVSLR
jgi:hypothetical protein